MPDLLILPVVLMGVLDPSVQKMPGGDVIYGTSFGSYATADECTIELQRIEPEYREDWPDVLFWCAEPVTTEGLELDR